MQEHAERIKHLMATVPYGAISTVGADGTPLGTPVFGTFNNQLHFFWASSPDAQHSQNIRDNGQAFLVLFNSREGSSGLYITGAGEELTDNAHIDYAYNLLEEAKQHLGQSMGSLERYRGNGPQRLYRILPQTIWTSQPVRDQDGAVIRSERINLSLDDLTS